MTNFYRKLEKPYREILTNIRDEKSVDHQNNFTEKIWRRIQKKNYRKLEKPYRENLWKIWKKNSPIIGTTLPRKIWWLRVMTLTTRYQKFSVNLSKGRPLNNFTMDGLKILGNLFQFLDLRRVQNFFKKISPKYCNIDEFFVNWIVIQMWVTRNGIVLTDTLMF